MHPQARMKKKQRKHEVVSIPQSAAGSTAFALYGDELGDSLPGYRIDPEAGIITKLGVSSSYSDLR
jgi:hypothetical protein